MMKSYERFVLALCVVILLLWSALLTSVDELRREQRHHQAQVKK